MTLSDFVPKRNRNGTNRLPQVQIPSYLRNADAQRALNAAATAHDDQSPLNVVDDRLKQLALAVTDQSRSGPISPLSPEADALINQSIIRHAETVRDQGNASGDDILKEVHAIAEQAEKSFTEMTAEYRASVKTAIEEALSAVARIRAAGDTLLAKAKDSATQIANSHAEHRAIFDDILTAMCKSRTGTDEAAKPSPADQSSVLGEV